MNRSPSRSFRDYLHTVLRFKWRATALLVGTMLLAALWLGVAPRQYESQAKLFVRVGRENVALDPTVRRDETIAVSASREAEMNSIVEHLRSRQILEKTLAILQPGCRNGSLQKREDEINELGRKLEVTSPRASTVVTLQYRADTPAAAQKTLATLVDVYLDEHMRINRASGSYEFFREQSELLKQQLETAQTALCDAKNRAGIASIEGRRAALESQISAVETQVHQVTAAAAASEAKLKALGTAIDSLPESLLRQMVGGVPNDGLANMENALFALRIQQQDVLSKCTEAHPLAIAAREQLHGVQQSLAQEEPDREQIIAALSAQEVARRASLAAQKEELHAQLGQLNDALVVLNKDAVLVDELTRETRQLQDQYLAYFESMEAARMDQALRTDGISNVSIIQPATFVPTPASPRKALILVLALLGGSLGAVVVVLASEQSDRTSRSRQDPVAERGVHRPAAVSRMPDRVLTTSGGNGAGVLAES